MLFRNIYFTVNMCEILQIVYLIKYETYCFGKGEQNLYENIEETTLNFLK